VLLLDMMRRRRPFGFKGQLEVSDEEEGDDAHLAATSGIEQRIDFDEIDDRVILISGYPQVYTGESEI
jgi:hypothetical protein